ncbi:hypothetical protein R6Q59_018246 [Mikania micrantha]
MIRQARAYDTPNSLCCTQQFLPTLKIGRMVHWPYDTSVWEYHTPKLTSPTASSRRETQNPCSPDGSEALPKGIVVKTSDLEMRPLWGPRKKRKNPKSPMSLLAMAVGKKQKANVNEMIKKVVSYSFLQFPDVVSEYAFIVYDCKDLEWSNRAIHLSAISQTKWWFAKRFLHPDVVSEYAYIFLWDEDLGVQNFDAGRYVSIIRNEGLRISQPALDPEKSEVHHEMTTREKGSTNDLIHALGLDMQLGYCAQGNRKQYIGIVDSEYVVHYGLPTLGGSENKVRLSKVYL